LWKSAQFSRRAFAMLGSSRHPITNVNTQTLRHAFCLGLVAAGLAACSQGEPQAVKPAPPSRVELAPKAVPPVAEPAPRVEPAQRKAEPGPTPRKLALAPLPPKAAPAPAPQRSEPVPARPPVASADGRSREQLALVPPAGFVEPARVEAPVQPAATALAATPIRVVNRVDPDFPRVAFQARVDRGMVKARMTLDGHGNVTRVDIVTAQPRRVFDDAVTLALAQWKFNDGAAGRTYDTEVVFQR